MATGAIEARYDGHAEFYDRLFAAYTDATDSPGAELTRLLGPPSGDRWVLDVCCGGGLSGLALAAAGWRVRGVDISADQLRLAAPRLGAVARADAHRLPFRSGTIGQATAMFAHTDVDDFAAVVREVARVLCPGGRFVYVGIHPCFVGPHIDSPMVSGERLSLSAGYADARWVPPEAFDTPRFGPGIRRRVGARHVPLAGLLAAFVDAGLVLQRVCEGGRGPVPWRFGLAAAKAPLGVPLLVRARPDRHPNQGQPALGAGALAVTPPRRFAEQDAGHRGIEFGQRAALRRRDGFVLRAETDRAGRRHRGAAQGVRYPESSRSGV
jgi:SAM-dependent methyltransferase